MTLSAAAELEKGMFFGWCPRCQTTTQVQAILAPITQVDPAWQKAMGDLTDEKANLVLALSNIIANYRKTDWSIDEWWNAMETSIAFGKFALDNLDKPEK
jgi:hypothetical protein